MTSPGRNFSRDLRALPAPFGAPDSFYVPDRNGLGACMQERAPSCRLRLGTTLPATDIRKWLWCMRGSTEGSGVRIENGIIAIPEGRDPGG